MARRSPSVEGDFITVGILSLVQDDGAISELKSLIKSDKIEPHFKKLQPEDLRSFIFEENWDGVFLLHSRDEGRLSLTDVKDGRYDTLLSTLCKEQESAPLICVIGYLNDDVKESTQESRYAMLRANQPSVFEYSNHVVLCGEINDVLEGDRKIIESFIKEVWKKINGKPWKDEWFDHSENSEASIQSSTEVMQNNSSPPRQKQIQDQKFGSEWVENSTPPSTVEKHIPKSKDEAEESITVLKEETRRKAVFFGECFLADIVPAKSEQESSWMGKWMKAILFMKAYKKSYEEEARYLNPLQMAERALIYTETYVDMLENDQDLRKKGEKSLKEMQTIYRLISEKKKKKEGSMVKSMLCSRQLGEASDTVTYTKSSAEQTVICSRQPGEASDTVTYTKTNVGRRKDKSVYRLKALFFAETCWTNEVCVDDELQDKWKKEMKFMQPTNEKKEKLDTFILAEGAITFAEVFLSALEGNDRLVMEKKLEEMKLVKLNIQLYRKRGKESK